MAPVSMDQKIHKKKYGVLELTAILALYVSVALVAAMIWGWDIGAGA